MLMVMPGLLLLSAQEGYGSQLFVVGADQLTSQGCTALGGQGLRQKVVVVQQPPAMHVIVGQTTQHNM